MLYPKAAAMYSRESLWQGLYFGVDEEWIVELGHVACFLACDRQQTR
jgi:hypothetical protein